jgi:hypothetical protein
MMIHSLNFDNHHHCFEKIFVNDEKYFSLVNDRKTEALLFYDIIGEVNHDQIIIPVRMNGLNKKKS